MARFVTGNTFGTTDTVTATTLNNAVNNAAISTDSVDGSTIEVNSNALRLKDSGITTAKIADSSSKTTGVTFAKMQHISTAKVLGRSTAGEGDVEEAFDFKDEDDLGGGSSSATALASQQSIKAYVDSAPNFTPSSYSGEESITLPNGLIMKTGFKSAAAGGEGITVNFPNAVISVQLTQVGGTTASQSNNRVTSVSISSLEMYVNTQSSVTGVYWLVIGH